MNPFLEKPMDLWQSFENWQAIYPKPYVARQVDPFTRTRVILMNGTEFESQWFMHHLSRHTDNADLRREVALLRRIEQQQQKKVSALKPADESLLEHTIGYEQLAVELTALLAQREPNPSVKAALDFALLEDFDHLYRYADLLEMREGINAEQLVGKYTEIMPGRPTIAEHRFPYDNIRAFVDYKTAAPITKLNIGIITAAEQQTMNYYMNIANLYPYDDGRKLYQEIGLIEEQHVSHYESLMDPNVTWLECMLNYQYTECYLYYSCYQDETDPAIKQLWEQQFMVEVAHLHKAAELLKRFEGKEWQQVIPNGEFPELLNFRSNIDYVRGVLAASAHMTNEKERYVSVDQLPGGYEFFRFQNAINNPVEGVPSHQTIQQYIKQRGRDYRFETAPNPIPALQDTRADNTTVGRQYQ